MRQQKNKINRKEIFKFKGNEIEDYNNIFIKVINKLEIIKNGIQMV